MTKRVIYICTALTKEAACDAFTRTSVANLSVLKHV